MGEWSNTVMTRRNEWATAYQTGIWVEKHGDMYTELVVYKYTYPWMERYFSLNITGGPYQEENTMSNETQTPAKSTFQNGVSIFLFQMRLHPLVRHPRPSSREPTSLMYS